MAKKNLSTAERLIKLETQMEFVLKSLKDLKRVTYDINRDVTSLLKQMKTHNACNGHGGKGAYWALVKERFVSFAVPAVTVTLCIIAIQYTGADEFTTELAETVVSAVNP